ncbi:uncharacterized protein LOC130721481 [Lotus japonicus]|uniref:uncharacterized protein LOC130721481 n=1 Tax=Lotus japonicus TaxID=34305 RepID=UPI0025825795|nr:uncharacterized protein LOC130721481 [Lotus japonicus]
MGKVWASWNVRGLGSSTKREAAKKILLKIKPEVCLLQESKLDENRKKTIVSWAKSIGMEFEFVPAIGVAGGLVSLWRKSTFKVVQVKKHQRKCSVWESCTFSVKQMAMPMNWQSQVLIEQFPYGR